MFVFLGISGFRFTEVSLRRYWFLQPIFEVFSQGEIWQFLDNLDIEYEWNVFCFSGSIGSGHSKTVSCHSISIEQFFLEA